MKYYIRTTGDRILDESYRQIAYTLLIDKEHRYIDFFVDKLEEISEEDCVIIEDDCVLCKNFKNEIENVISKFPDKIINFFQFPCNKYFLTHESNDFLLNQCTYYPKRITKKLAQKMRELRPKFLDKATDELENIALHELNETHIQYRPCLVQHLNFDSMLGHTIEYIRTPFFLDYLNQNNLDYEHLSQSDLKVLNREFKYHILKKRKEWEAKKK